MSSDQGAPSGGTNTGLITAIDNTANNDHGTLMNFSLSGSTSNFTTNPQTILPVNLTYFTATKDANQALLAWQTAQEEENSADFFVERSGDGKQYSTIGTVPAAGNSSTPRELYLHRTLLPFRAITIIASGKPISMGNPWSA